ncbi:MAG: DUF4440 domain-containing protein [Cyclobacteriaceae bacterium]
MIIKTYFSCLLLLSACVGFGQTRSSQKEINEQVWEPFINAYNNRDNEALSKVHSKDMIRVVQDDGRIYGYDIYFKPDPDSLRVKWAVWKRTIELRFVQRIASDTEAFEVGYYKVVSKNTETGESRTSYGKFHVLLRKEIGKWKILMDADANEGTTEEIFSSANPMDQ